MWGEINLLPYERGGSSLMRESVDLSKDAVFRLLSNPRRRYVLYYLREQGGQARLEELTRSLAAWETDKSPAELEDADEKRVYVSLYQTHVPKLEEHGVVEYDTDSTVVSLTDAASQIDQYLTVDRSALPWQAAYVVLATLAVVVTALVSLEVGPFAGVDPALVAGGVAVGFVALVIGQVLYDRYIDQSIPEELEPD